jgi:hypothetical protein
MPVDVAIRGRWLTRLGWSDRLPDEPQQPLPHPVAAADVLGDHKMVPGPTLRHETKMDATFTIVELRSSFDFHVLPMGALVRDMQELITAPMRILHP